MIQQVKYILVILLLAIFENINAQKVTRFDIDTIPSNIPGQNGWSLPTTVLAQSPKITPYSLAPIKIQPKVTPIDFEKLTSNTPGKNGFSFPKTYKVPKEGFLVYENDTIYAPVKVKAKAPEIKRALEFRHKDNTAFDIQYLDVDQNMPSSNIQTIVFDDKQNVWFGTYQGKFARYDGNNFYVYGVKQGFDCNSVKEIMIDSKGNLWFGTTLGGLIMFDGDTFTYFKEEQGFTERNVMVIYEDKKGAIWVGSYLGGLWHYDGENVTRYTTKEGLPSNDIQDIVEDDNGTIWIATRGGVCSFDGVSFTPITSENGLSNNMCYSISIDANKDIWIGTNDGFNIYKPDKIVSYSSETDLKKIEYRTIHHDEDGITWLGSNGAGLIKFDGEQIEIIDINSGLTNDVIFDIAQDFNGNFWIATYGGGLCKFRPNSFTHLTSEQGLFSSVPLCINQDNAGDMWFTTFLVGVTRFNGKTFETYSKFVEQENSVCTIHQDHSGNYWMGTMNGLVVFDGKKFTRYTTENGFTDNRVFSIYESENHDIWFGTFRGVSKYDGKSFKTFNENHGLSKDLTLCITEDKQGNMWFGTFDGVAKIEEDRLTLYTEKDGLPHKVVRCILTDGHGNIWAGTDGGLVLIADDKDGAVIKEYTDNDIITGNTILSLIEDSKGRLWVGTEVGIVCLSIDDNKAITTLANFTQLDGLLNGLDVVQNSVHEDDNGVLWWGMGKGITRLDLDKFVIQENEPQIQLNKVDINGSEVNYHVISDSIAYNFDLGLTFDSIARFYEYPLNPVFSHDNNYLTFHYSAIDLTDPKSMTYNYMLNGFDDKWNSTAETYAEYRNLPGGDYTFKVKAINKANKWSETFEYQFKVLPPWYLEWWAFVVYAIIGIGIIYVIIRLNSLRLKQLNLQLEKTVAERTEELRVTNEKLLELDKFKEGLTGMIVHDLKNPLNGIINVSNSYTINEQVYRMKEFGKQVLNMVVNILDVHKYEDTKMVPDKSVVSLNDIIQSAIADTEFLLNEKGVSVKAKIEKAYNINVDKKLIIRVFVNLLTNAIKYSKAGDVIFINVSEDNDDQIRVEISDSGQGIPQDQVDKIFDKFVQISAKDSGKIRSTGLGLTFCKMAIESHNGNIGVISEVNKGTTFWFVLSLHSVEDSSSLSINSSIDSNEIKLTQPSKQAIKPVALLIEKHRFYEITE
ncbi:ligand-binding sensor domain-containing protein, partial [Fulvivirga lutimaris]|uniref:ligand-binding sensor domain-containing protein n=1 Tax=Fulvivirga lutimaris TaxID=1819566 RepID=UPI0012BCF73A